MKKLLLISTILTVYFSLITFICPAQFPGWMWAKGSGGSGNDLVKSVAADANGTGDA